MSKRVPGHPVPAEDQEDWFRASFAGVAGEISIGNLKKHEIEQLAVAAIREHRRRLERAQKLHEQVGNADADEMDDLVSAYDRAIRAHDDHHMVVHMLVDMLGYVPKLEEEQTTH